MARSASGACSLSRSSRRRTAAARTRSARHSASTLRTEHAGPSRCPLVLPALARSTRSSSADPAHLALGAAVQRTAAPPMLHTECTGRALVLRRVVAQGSVAEDRDAGSARARARRAAAVWIQRRAGATGTQGTCCAVRSRVVTEPEPRSGVAERAVVLERGRPGRSASCSPAAGTLCLLRSARDALDDASLGSRCAHRRRRPRRGRRVLSDAARQLGASASLVVQTVPLSPH